LAHVKRRPEALFRHGYPVGIEGAPREEIKHVLASVDGNVERNRRAEQKGSLRRSRTIIDRLFESSTRSPTMFRVAGDLGEEAVSG
jgi:aspartate carbamoyltransferase catalytic subunit